jgi:hypothetical protein
LHPNARSLHHSPRRQGEPISTAFVESAVNEIAVLSRVVLEMPMTHPVW